MRSGKEFMRPPALASAVRVNSLEILALLGAALCASFVLAPACAADLIWEVENPFRFFKPTRSFALHLAHREGSQRPRLQGCFYAGSLRGHGRQALSAKPPRLGR